MHKSLRKSRVRWFSDKPKKRKRGRRSPRQIASLRVSEIARLYRRRYGITLPDDDAGRDDAEVAVNHLASLPGPEERIALWLELWAPWMPAGERRATAAAAIADTQYWTADQLAWRLHVTGQERQELALTTIGAVDETSAARRERRQTSAKVRQTSLRRAKGVKPRSEYLAASVEKSEPWKAEGVSRATWYRRRKGETETGPNAP